MRIEISKKQYLNHIKDNKPQILNSNSNVVGPEIINGEYSCKSCMYYMDTSCKIESRNIDYKSFNCGKLLVSVSDTNSLTPILCPYMEKKD